MRVHAGGYRSSSCGSPSFASDASVTYSAVVQAVLVAYSPAHIFGLSIRTISSRLLYAALTILGLNATVSPPKSNDRFRKVVIRTTLLVRSTVLSKTKLRQRTHTRGSDVSLELSSGL